MGDPDRLLQVVTNLISNAVKFSPKNSSISIALSSDAHGVTLSVVDPGRGIPADQLETIFDRFQQVDSSDSRQKGGTGLGLAICKAIVQQHAGRIWAERNPDGGSTFRVHLPFKQMHLYTAESIAASAEHFKPLMWRQKLLHRYKIEAGKTRRAFSAEKALLVFGGILEQTY